MQGTPKSTFDPTKILGPYPLLAAFLLVIESLLGFWFFQAEGAFERIAAGSLMALVFGGFLYTVIRVGAQQMSAGTISPQGLGTLTPASEEVSAKQIEVPEPETIVGPDRSYTINRPPGDWIVRELTASEWHAENMGIKHPPVEGRLRENANQSLEVLVIQTGAQNSLIPIPGKTTIDGAKVPTALETPLLTQIAIIPMNRAQPPFFVERPFIHNFFQTASLIFNTNVMTLYDEKSSIIPNTKRHRLSAEFRQKIQDGLLNGTEVKDLSYSLLLIGIEGDIRDYTIMVKYPSLPGADGAKLAEENETIQSLINSFRPVKVLNPEKQLEEWRAQGEKHSREIIAKAGGNVFFAEFTILLYRISGVDLDNPDARLLVMKLLKPFKALWDQANLQDEEILPLWDALEKAESGDASEFKQVLAELIGQVTSEPQAQDVLSTSSEVEANPQNDEQVTQGG